MRYAFLVMFLWATAAIAQSNLVAASYPGADASVQINACVADVIAHGGGTCDARTLGGAQTMSQQINLGSTAQVAARIGLTLLLPDTAVWTWHLTDGTSCGIYQYSSTSLIGNQPGAGGNRMVLTVSSGAVMDSIYCTDTALNYVRAEGFAVWNNAAGSTFKTGVIHLRNLVDESSFRNIFAENYYGDVWHVESACCGVRFENIHGTSNGCGYINNGSQGGIPLWIGSGSIHSVAFYDSSFNQPGCKFPDIKIHAGSNLSLTFYGAYMEGNGLYDATTPMVQIDGGAGAVHFIAGAANTEQPYVGGHPPAATKAVFQTGAQQLTVDNMEVSNTSLAIVDKTNGTQTPVTLYSPTGNLGTILPYRTK